MNDFSSQCSFNKCCLFEIVGKSDAGGPVMQPEHDPDNAEVVIYINTTFFFL